MKTIHGILPSRRKDKPTACNVPNKLIFQLLYSGDVKKIKKEEKNHKTRRKR